MESSSQIASVHRSTTAKLESELNSSLFPEENDTRFNSSTVVMYEASTFGKTRRSNSDDLNESRSSPKRHESSAQRHSFQEQQSPTETHSHRRRGSKASYSLQEEESPTETHSHRRHGSKPSYSLQEEESSTKTHSHRRRGSKASYSLQEEESPTKTHSHRRRRSQGSHAHHRHGSIASHSLQEEPSPTETHSRHRHGSIASHSLQEQESPTNTHTRRSKGSHRRHRHESIASHLLQEQESPTETHSRHKRGSKTSYLLEERESPTEKHSHRRRGSKTSDWLQERESPTKTDSPHRHESRAKSHSPNRYDSRAEKHSPHKHESRAKSLSPRAQESEAAGTETHSPLRHESTGNTVSPHRQESAARTETHSPQRQESIAKTPLPYRNESAAETHSTQRQESTGKPVSPHRQESAARTETHSPQRQESIAKTPLPYRNESAAETHSTQRQESTGKPVSPHRQELAARTETHSPQEQESITKKDSPHRQESIAKTQSPSRQESIAKKDSPHRQESTAKTQPTQRQESTARAQSPQTTHQSIKITSSIKASHSLKEHESAITPTLMEPPVGQSLPEPQRYEAALRNAPPLPKRHEPVVVFTSQMSQKQESDIGNLPLELQKERPPTRIHSILKHHEIPQDPGEVMHSQSLQIGYVCTGKPTSPTPPLNPKHSVSARKSKKDLTPLNDYIPIWYQQAGSRSSDWLDGAAYYAHKYDPTHQVGAFAPKVDVERMVKREKKKRKIKDVTPYSNEMLKKKSNKKKNVKKGARTSRTSSQGGRSTVYTVQRFAAGRPARWNYDAGTADPTHQIRSAPVFKTTPRAQGTAPDHVQDIYPYTRKNRAATQSSVYTVSSVSSGTATTAFDAQVYNTLQANYREPCTCDIDDCQCDYKPCTAKKSTNKKKELGGGGGGGGIKPPAINAKALSEPCNCAVDECKCMFTPCSSRNKQGRGRELTDDDRCINPSLMSACSRGRSGSRTKDEVGGSQVGDRAGRGNDRIFVRRLSNGLDINRGCECTTSDCYCIYKPCASRERSKRRFKRKKKKKPLKRGVKPKKQRSIDNDKCILCHIDAIEKPFSWWMSTCCITWIWHSREFIRHCGKSRGELPDYTEKPASLHESAVTRWWERQYLYDDEDDPDDDNESVANLGNNEQLCTSK